jgi:two-component system OmpR family sensor kinase
MFFTKSLRWRLQIWYGLILFAVLTGFGFAAWRLQHERMLAGAGERLKERSDQALRLMRQSGPPDGGRPRPGGPRPEGEPPDRGYPPPRGEERPPPDRPARPLPPMQAMGALEQTLKLEEIPGNTLTIWRRDGPILATTGEDRSRTKPVTDPNAGTSPVISVSGQRMTLVAATPPGEVIQVTRDLTSELASLHHTLWQLGAAGAGILALGLAGGWWAAGRALAPLSAITAKAERLSAGTLAERLPVSGAGDELGQLASVLNGMLGRLESSFSQQACFISDAAHELRTPVSVMLTQTQTALRRERPSEEYRQSLEVCQRAAGRMRQLIESLLALARLDAGQQQMKRLRFDLARAAADQVELLTPLAAARQITIHSDLTPITVEGDPDYLSLVAANLLTNAIHYNRDGGSLHLVLQRDGEEAMLTVRDTGEGMAPAALARIFDRFYRADQSRSLPAGRTGLGLSITKSIIEAHHGSIAVASTPGEGTTFTVRVPVALKADG